MSCFVHNPKIFSLLSQRIKQWRCICIVSPCSMFQPLMCHPLSQDVCTSLGCVQELNREAGQLSHGASEETTGTYKRGSEVRGRAGQSTQKGKAMKNWGKLWVIFFFNWVLVWIQPRLFHNSLNILNVKRCLNKQLDKNIAKIEYIITVFIKVCRIWDLLGEM